MFLPKRGFGRLAIGGLGVVHGRFHYQCKAVSGDVAMRLPAPNLWPRNLVPLDETRRHPSETRSVRNRYTHSEPMGGDGLLNNVCDVVATGNGTPGRFLRASRRRTLVCVPKPNVPEADQIVTWIPHCCVTVASRRNRVGPASTLYRKSTVHCPRPPSRSLR